TISSSPKLIVRGGWMNGDLGGALSVDWTSGNLNSKGGSFPGGSADLSGNRFRILANLVFHHALAPKVELSARLGAGIDIAHYGYDVMILGSTTSGSDTDVGVAGEAAMGAWFRVGRSTDLGVELGLPIGYHSAKKPDNVMFDYTSYDIDLLFGVRLR